MLPKSDCHSMIRTEISDHVRKWAAGNTTALFPYVFLDTSSTHFLWDSSRTQASSVLEHLLFQALSGPIRDAPPAPHFAVRFPASCIRASLPLCTAYSAFIDQEENTQAQRSSGVDTSPSFPRAAPKVAACVGELRLNTDSRSRNLRL